MTFVEPRNDLTCEICYEHYYSHSYDLKVDRRPKIVCQEGHSFCGECSKVFRKCPNCSRKCLDNFIVNIALMNIIDSYQEESKNIYEIEKFPISHIKNKPIANGTYADILSVVWKKKSVALKKLRISIERKQMKSVIFEMNIAVTLKHPNIAKVFGVITGRNNYLGVLMELSDRGSLDQDINKNLSIIQKIRIASCICDGLEYLQSKRFSHRNLKPSNILLFGTNPKAKISDFGTSKVIQSILYCSPRVGTLKYTAPELLEDREIHTYGDKVDNFSLAMILYEMFAGKDPFPGATNLQVIGALTEDIRPEFPSNFPERLKNVVTLGWKKEAEERPNVRIFSKTLLEMSQDNSLVKNFRPNLMSYYSNPNDDVYWSPFYEIRNSQQLRAKMIRNILDESPFNHTIVPHVYEAMVAVPRHLFVHDFNITSQSEQEKLNYIYSYKNSCYATTLSKESSPEIVGVQLSLAKVHTGDEVLLVGVKGGYIASVAAQIVGINGRVVSASSSKFVLAESKSRVDKYSPFKNIMEWIFIEDIHDEYYIYNKLKDNNRFNSIIYCGALYRLPTKLLDILKDDYGCLLAPIIKDKNIQQFEMKFTSFNSLDIEKNRKFVVNFDNVI